MNPAAEGPTKAATHRANVRISEQFYDKTNYFGVFSPKAVLRWIMPRRSTSRGMSGPSTDWKAKDRNHHKQRPVMLTRRKKGAEQTSWNKIGLGGQPARLDTSNRVAYPNNSYQGGSIRGWQTRLDSHLEAVRRWSSWAPNQIWFTYRR